jgi:hypothetical protein
MVLFVTGWTHAYRLIMKTNLTGCYLVANCPCHQVCLDDQVWECTTNSMVNIHCYLPSKYRRFALAIRGLEHKHDSEKNLLRAVHTCILVYATVESQMKARSGGTIPLQKTQPHWKAAVGSPRMTPRRCSGFQRKCSQAKLRAALLLSLAL